MGHVAWSSDMKCSIKCLEQKNHLFSELIAKDDKTAWLTCSYLATDQKAGGSNPSWRAK